jgi:hypothetical protein
MDEEMYVDLQRARFDRPVPQSAMDKALVYLNDNRWTVIGKSRQSEYFIPERNINLPLHSLFYA